MKNKHVQARLKLSAETLRTLRVDEVRNIVGGAGTLADATATSLGASDKRWNCCTQL